MECGAASAQQRVEDDEHGCTQTKLYSVMIKLLSENDAWRNLSRLM